LARFEEQEDDPDEEGSYEANMQSDDFHQDVAPTALAMHVQESTHLTLFYQGEV